jgi:hypothetical protein
MKIFKFFHFKFSWHIYIFSHFPLVVVWPNFFKFQFKIQKNQFFLFPSGGMAKSFSNSKKIEFIYFKFSLWHKRFFSKPVIAKITYLLPLPKNGHVLHTTVWCYSPLYSRSVCLSPPFLNRTPGRHGLGSEFHRASHHNCFRQSPDSLKGGREAEKNNSSRFSWRTLRLESSLAAGVEGTWCLLRKRVTASWPLHQSINLGMQEVVLTR